MTPEQYVSFGAPEDRSVGVTPELDVSFGAPRSDSGAGRKSSKSFKVVASKLLEQSYGIGLDDVK